MTNRNYATYDAFFTFEMLNEVVKKSGNSQEKIATKLKTIKEEMKRVSKLPSEVAVKPVTSIELVQQTNATSLIKKLDQTFTHQSVGEHLEHIIRINTSPHPQEKYAGIYAILCEYGTLEKTRINRRLDAEMLQIVHGAINTAKSAVADFDEDPSGWILREDIHILLQHLKYEEGERERLQKDLTEAWMRARRAQVALSGLDQMFGELYGDTWKHVEDAAECA